jgi:hypothetical protein
MTRTRIRRHVKRLFILSLISALALGCELIVDFDRTKIPVESTETGPPPDGTAPETGTDGSTTDGPDEGGDGSTNDGGDANQPDGDGGLLDVSLG